MKLAPDSFCLLERNIYWRYFSKKFLLKFSIMCETRSDNKDEYIFENDVAISDKYRSKLRNKFSL